jgi:hypothetical protein
VEAAKAAGDAEMKEAAAEAAGDAAAGAGGFTGNPNGACAEYCTADLAAGDSCHTAVGGAV